MAGIRYINISVLNEISSTLTALFLDAPEAPAGNWCVASNFTRIQMKIFLLNW